MYTVRSWAALSLGRIGPDALPALIEALKPEQVVFVRRAAADAVGKMGPKAEPAIAQLLVALADQEEGIWSNAAESLVAIGRAALPPLRLAVESNNSRVRGHAAKVLLKLESGDLPTIRRSQGDKPTRPASI